MLNYIRLIVVKKKQNNLSYRKKSSTGRSQLLWVGMLCLIVAFSGHTYLP